MKTGLTGFLFLGKEKKANGAGGPWLMRIEQPGISALRVGACLATLGCLGLEPDRSGFSLPCGHSHSVMLSGSMNSITGRFRALARRFATASPIGRCPFS